MVALFRCKSAFYIFVYRIATKNYRKSIAKVSHCDKKQSQNYRKNIALRQKTIASKKGKKQKNVSKKETKQKKETKEKYSKYI